MVDVHNRHGWPRVRALTVMEQASGVDYVDLEYYKNGMIRKEELFDKHNKNHGMTTFLRQDGTLWATYLYNGGELCQITHYQEDETPSQITTYENGKIAYDETIKNGQKYHFKYAN